MTRLHRETRPERLGTVPHPDWLPADQEEWRDFALCREVDSELFFPEKGGSTREAKGICQACEVRAECLEYALAHDERSGIWGGMSERERRFFLATGQVRQPKVRDLDVVLAERDGKVAELFEAGLTRAAIAAALRLTKAQVDSSRRRITKRSAA